MRGRTRSNRSSGIEIAPVRACTWARQVLERDLTGAEPPPHRARATPAVAATAARPRPERRRARRPRRPRPRRYRRATTSRRAAARRPAPAPAVSPRSSASSKSTRWGRSTASTITFSSARLRSAIRARSSTPTSAQSWSRSVRDRCARRIDLRHALADDEIGDDHRRSRPGSRRCRRAQRARPAVGGAVEGERFVLDPALHGRIGRLDLVAPQPDRPVEAREIVGAAIVGRPQLHEQHPVAGGLGAVRERLRMAAGLPDHAEAGDDRRAQRRERFRIRRAVRCTKDDEYERSDDDADRDRRGPRRARRWRTTTPGGVRVPPTVPPQRTLPLPAHPHARERHHRGTGREVRRAREPRIVEPADPDAVQRDRAGRLRQVEAPGRPTSSRPAATSAPSTSTPSRRHRRWIISATEMTKITLTAITWATPTTACSRLLGSRDTASTRSACAPPTV